MNARLFVPVAIASALVLHSLAPSSAVASPPVETVVTYDHGSFQAPESIASDHAGNLYVSLSLTGELSRIDRFGEVTTLAQLPVAPYQWCDGFMAAMTALTYTPWGIYVNVNSCDPDERGIWWVAHHGGDAQRIAAMAPDTFANGIAHRYGMLYVADSFSSRIFRVPVWGGEPEVWLDSPLLEPLPAPFSPLPFGANGLQFFEDELYVAHSVSGDLVAIEVEPDQSAGAQWVHANVTPGCDDFAIDEEGGIYCTTDFFNEIHYVDPGGTASTLLDVTDGLDGPTSATFGRGPDARSLYVANAAFPFYPNGGNPSVLRVELDVDGYRWR